MQIIKKPFKNLWQSGVLYIASLTFSKYIVISVYSWNKTTSPEDLDLSISTISYHGNTFQCQTVTYLTSDTLKADIYILIKYNNITNKIQWFSRKNVIKLFMGTLTVTKISVTSNTIYSTYSYSQSTLTSLHYSDSVKCYLLFAMACCIKKFSEPAVFEDQATGHRNNRKTLWKFSASHES